MIGLAAEANVTRAPWFFPLAGGFVVAASIALLPLSWIVLDRWMGFNVKPLHVQQMCLILLAFAYVFIFIKGLQHLIRTYPLFWMTYSIYVLFLLVVVLLQDSPESASLVKQIVYFGAALLTATLVLTLPPERVVRALWYGGLGGLLLYVLAAEMSMNAFGQSYIGRVLVAIMNGRVHELMWGIHMRMFNALSEDANFGTALRNTVAGGLFVTFIVLNIVKPAIIRLGTISRCVHMLSLCATAILLFALLSRSVLLATALSVLCYALLRMLGRDVKATELGIAVSICLLVGVVVAASESLSQLFFYRFFEQAGAYDSRLRQYTESLVVIDEGFFFGHGFGARVGKNQVHNVFLSSWVQGGLLCFFLAAAFYAAFLGSALYYGLQIGSRNLRWTLPLSPEWAVTLTILPLVRVWLSGDGGRFTMAEWTAVALFYGIFGLNAANLRRSYGRDPAVVDGFTPGRTGVRS